MSLESDIYAALYAVCPRVFPDVAPLATPLPRVTWQQIGGQSPSYLERAVVDRRNAYIQVNVWSATRAEANTLAASIESALTLATTFQATPQNALIATHDEETNLYGTIQDFTIWASR